ncbi:MAG TPA: response regulator [Xanthomonadaceae bacterium]|jgi:PleD family two-component response regulator|nr:response regulator [Xanthomonadaceae bacterium]
MTYSATILIVDDDAGSRDSLAQLLQNEGYSTLSAANGKQALAIVAQNPPDLILLDVVMDDLDGYDVAASIKANPATASIPIIMVTGHDGRGAQVVAFDAGAEAFVLKPVDMAVLSLRIRNLLRLAQATPVHEIQQIASP